MIYGKTMPKTEIKTSGGNGDNKFQCEQQYVVSMYLGALVVTSVQFGWEIWGVGEWDIWEQEGVWKISVLH